jgi:hypothetical protein
MKDSPVERQRSGLLPRVLVTLGYLALTPVAFYAAVMSVFLSDSGEHLDAVAFLIVTSFIWPITCVIAAILPWLLLRRPRWVRLSVLALPIFYPPFWMFGLYPLAFALD